jgi:hypothetical protein
MSFFFKPAAADRGYAWGMTTRALAAALVCVACGADMKRTAAPPAPAAAAPAAAAVEPAAGLLPLAWMIGEWRGRGWMQRGPGPRESFDIHEQVRWAAGGALMVVDGLGKDAAGKVVHQAFAVISVDPATGKPTLRAYRAGAGEVTSPVEIGEAAASWGFAPPPGGRVRFSFSQTPAGEWREVGEFSRDGTSYAPFLEMTLVRSP